MQKRATMEIERKYLIEMPSEAMLRAVEGVAFFDIWQTYLKTENKGETHRVRKKVAHDGHTVYIETRKVRRSVLSCEEYEREIDEGEYEALLARRDQKRKTVRKRRYVLPYEDHLLEIDIYPFWTEQAILEIELESEDEAASVPAYIKILRDVSADLRFKNHALALDIPDLSADSGTLTSDT